MITSSYLTGQLAHERIADRRRQAGNWRLAQAARMSAGPRARRRIAAVVPWRRGLAVRAA